MKNRHLDEAQDTIAERLIDIQHRNAIRVAQREALRDSSTRIAELEQQLDEASWFNCVAFRVIAERLLSEHRSMPSNIRMPRIWFQFWRANTHHSNDPRLTRNKTQHCIDRRTGPNKLPNQLPNNKIKQNKQKF